MSNAWTTKKIYPRQSQCILKMQLYDSESFTAQAENHKNKIAEKIISKIKYAQRIGEECLHIQYVPLQ